MSNYGYCSRRKAEKLIEEGKVKVNGKTISIGDKASESDKITVNNELISKQKKVYLMLHKPVGCVTAVHDQQYRTVMHYIKTEERVFPVGRLDYNTSGLLLLTNDGDLANKIMHPRYETKKTYVAFIENPITSSQLKSIKSGIELEDGKTRPAAVNVLKNKIIELTIHEGRNRIVRRMLEEIGVKITSLKRTKIGKLSLGDLKPKEYRILSEKDIEKVFS
jgi:23S rRNA pseudouridine2605 synthase|tara:strand:- start:25577 stop:26236 length:660 start_codon:yes stop_codon:yes gene_type:complete